MSPPRGNSNFPTTYRIGAGRVAELPEAARELGFSHPLVVTDAGVASLPWFAGFLRSLSATCGEAEVFSAVDPNPTEANVLSGLARYRATARRGVVLVGGGSPMDVGKCVALLADNPGEVFDYEDVGDNWRRADGAKVVPTIAVPTTAGTGSEVGRCSVITDVRDHAKKIIFHPKMQPSLVIADPELTLGLPPRLTAATGMDALAHAFEAFCAPGYHPMADGIALEAMRLVRDNLERATRDGGDLEARTHMLMAASMGATAFQKGLGLVHAWSHPIGGRTGLHHGTANAIFLPYVMIHNREVIGARMDGPAGYLELRGSTGFEAMLEWMLDLRRELGLPHTLAEAGVPRRLGHELVKFAASDPSLATNPKPCSEDELIDVFDAAWSGRLD